MTRLSLDNPAHYKRIVWLARRIASTGLPGVLTEGDLVNEAALAMLRGKAVSLMDCKCYMHSLIRRERKHGSVPARAGRARRRRIGWHENQRSQPAHQEAGASIEQALAAMPARDRSAIEHALAGFTSDEIGAAHGVSGRAIRKIIAKHF